MKKTSLIFILIFVVSFSSTEGQQPGIGKVVVEFVEGSARVRVPGSEGWISVHDSTELFREYKFRTLEDSRAGLRSKNGSEIRLNEQTYITIDFSDVHLTTQDGPILKRYTDVVIDSGDVWTASGPELSVKTTVARIGGANANYRVSVGKDGSTEVKLYQGSIGVYRSFTKDENLEIQKNREEAEKTGEEFKEPEYWIKELSPYQKLVVSSDGEVVYRGEFSPDDIDEKTEWVKWNKNRDKME